MSPSPLKEKSNHFPKSIGPTRSSSRSRLVQAMSSPYTPKVRSKLSQCMSLTEASPFDDKHEEEPLTQSDVSFSQNTVLSSQEPPKSRELFHFKSKPSSPLNLEFEKEDNESIRNEHGTFIALKY